MSALGATLDPATSPVAAAIMVHRAEILPALLATGKAQLAAMGLSEAGVEAFLKSEDGAEALQKVETAALLAAHTVYLEQEHKRRAEWEADIEKRLGEVRRDAGFDRGEPAERVT